MQNIRTCFYTFHSEALVSTDQEPNGKLKIDCLETHTISKITLLIMTHHVKYNLGHNTLCGTSVMHPPWSLPSWHEVVLIWNVEHDCVEIGTTDQRELEGGGGRKGGRERERGRGVEVKTMWHTDHSTYVGLVLTWMQ